jgi:hypothetical protein
VLKGVDTDMFWSAVYDHPFRVFGGSEVYVAPEDRPNIAAEPQLGPAPAEFFADRAAMQNGTLVLDVSGGHVREVPGIRQGGELSSRVDVGSGLLAGQIGPAWYPQDGGFRWMAKRATVKLHGPRGPAEQLYLTGYCPAAALKSGPLGMQVSVDDERLAAVWIRKPDAQFTFSFTLPPRLAGRPVVEVAVELERTFVAAPDPRELGVTFGVFEIR